MNLPICILFSSSTKRQKTAAFFSYGLAGVAGVVYRDILQSQTLSLLPVKGTGPWIRILLSWMVRCRPKYSKSSVAGF